MGRIGLTIRKVPLDQDVCELFISASDGSFAGSARAYATPDEPRGLAEVLSGFPARPEDSRQYAFGEFGPNIAGDAAALRFFCIDSVGHAFAEIRLEAESPLAGVFRTVVLAFPVEAAAIDRFVSELNMISERGTATLSNHPEGWN